MIRVVIAEDNNFLAQSIEEKLSFFSELKYKFRGIDGQDLIEKIDEDHLVDIILMDIQMPVMNGIEATRVIKQKYPQIKIVMLTVFDDDNNILRAIQAGANGYFLKDENPEDLYRGLLEIMDGGASMTPSIAAKTLKLLCEPLKEIHLDEKTDHQLTKREVEVLEHLSVGLNYAEIGDNLNISAATVRKHIENIYRKLQVRNKLEAVNIAKRDRII